MAGDHDNIPADERHLRFQVVTHLESGEPHGAESYLRWIDADDRMVPTMAWLPQAAASGSLFRYSIDMIPDWVEAMDALPSLRIAINAFTQQLLDEDWMTAMIAASERTGGLPALELAHIQFDPRIAAEAMPAIPTPTIPDLHERIARLQAAGIEIWLDDYGDTYLDESIFEYQTIDVVKLDRSFLNLRADALSEAAAAAHANGKRVLLEGIETAEDARRAMAFGIEYGQGFHFGWPMPLDEFTEFVAELGR